MTGARHYRKQPDDNQDFGPYQKKPPREVLAKLCETHTTAQIADMYGVFSKRARDWLHRSGLKAQPDGRPQNLLRIEQVLGSPEAAKAWIPEHSTQDAMEFFSIGEQVANRWERYYGVRFKRVCKGCNESLPYADMQVRAGGRIYQICKPCYALGRGFEKRQAEHQDKRGKEETPDTMAMRFARSVWRKCEQINGYRFSMTGAGNVWCE